MKPIPILLLIITMGFTSCKSQSQHLEVMTYNIRLDVASDGENAWPNSKDFVSSQLLFLQSRYFGRSSSKAQSNGCVIKRIKGIQQPWYWQR